MSTQNGGTNRSTHNPQDTSHAQWEDGIVVGFESVPIIKKKETENNEVKKEGQTDTNDSSNLTDPTTQITQITQSTDATSKGMSKGEGTSTRLKVRFLHTTEWINAGATYNFHSVTEGDGDHWECEWVPALHRDEHEAEQCGHRMVTCSLGCEQEVAAKHLEHHISKTCPYRSTPCPQGCGQAVPLKQLADHKDEFCTKRIVECDQCEESMKQDELFEHMRMDCVMHRVRCPNACSMKPRRIKLQDHLENKCAKRVIQCKWKCDVPIFADAKKYHESTICAKRELLCTEGGVGCGESILFFMVKDHATNSCGRRIIECSLDCGVSIMAKDEIGHQSNFCPKRLYQCYLGCGEMVSVCERTLHEDEYCMRRIRSCTLGCGKIVRADMMDGHVIRKCRRRIVGCPHGCDDIVRAEDVDAHGAMCGMRPVECGAGSNACCRQLRQWTRMIPIGKPFPALPYAPPVLPTEDELKEQHNAEEINVDRDGLPNGSQEFVVETVEEIDASDLIESRQEERLVEQRVLIRCDRHFSTGLHRASAMGDIDLVRAMVGSLLREDLDADDPEGTTPLMRAAFHGHADVVRMLVESGATIDLENSRGRTAMMEAVIQNHPSVVWELMMLGGEYTRQNRFKQVPLQMAIRYDVPENRERVHEDEFGTEFTVMELVTDIAHLRDEHRKLLIAISTQNYQQVEEIVNGGELHRPCHIHQLHAEKPMLEATVEECKAKAEHYRNEMEFCRKTSNECDIRVKILQRKLRENRENQQMIAEEESSWAFAAHEKQEEVIRVLRGLSATHVSSVIKLGRRPAPVVQILLKGLCILRGVPPAADSHGEKTYIGPAHALLTNRQLLKFLRQYDPAKQATASGEVIDRLQMEIIGAHPNLNDDIERLPEHHPLLYALATWISSCLFLNRRSKVLPALASTISALYQRREELDHELAPNLMQQRFLTKELALSETSFSQVQEVSNQAQTRYDGLDRMIWVTRVLQFRESARHSALSWACSRHKASDVVVQMLLDNGAAIDTTTEEEYAAATLMQLHVRHLQWMSSRGMWTPARAYAFRMREMSHIFTAQRSYAKLEKEQRTSRSPLAEALYAGNHDIADLLIQNGATLTKVCHVMPSGHGPFVYFYVPLSASVKSEMPGITKKSGAGGGKETEEEKRKREKKKKKKRKNKHHGRMRLSLGAVGPGKEGQLTHCEVVSGPADCHIAMFDPPASFMTVSRLGVVMRQGKKEFFEGPGWVEDTVKMSHHRSVQYAWENITQRHEEILNAEIDRQRRLIIAKQVERTQRIGRIKMTKSVHLYLFEEALRLVDEEEIAIDTETLWGYTALGLAASEGTECVNEEGIQVLAVEMLLDRPSGKIRPAINRETNGMTPLMWAANHGHVDVAESLIDRGAIVDYVSSEWAPPHILPPPGAFAAEAAAAAAMVQEDLTRLVRLYPAGSSDSEHALVEAAEEIAKAAQNGYALSEDVDGENNRESTTGNNVVITTLETNKDSLYQKKKTPLITATCAGHKKMVWLLLQYGANQRLRDSTGRNALEWAAALGNHDL